MPTIPQPRGASRPRQDLLSGRAFLPRRAFLAALLPGAPSLAAAAAARQPRPAPGAARPDRGRDPFRAAEGTPAAPRPPGLRGIGVMETQVRGIVRFPRDPEEDADGSGLAILEGAGNGFVAGPGDRLFDGIVGRIEADGVVFWLDGDPDRPVYRLLAVAPASDGGNDE